MAQDKRVFIGGMDKDSDPRLIKDGDYRDALNIRNIASMDGTSGSVENIEGNTLVPFSFIDEVDQTIEFTSSSDGQIVVEEVPVEQIFRSQQIIFNGKEEYNVVIAFFMYYQTVTVNSDGSVTLNEPGLVQPSTYIDQPFLSPNPLGSAAYFEWIGNLESTKTTDVIVNNLFGPGAQLSSLNVQDYTTGQMIQIQVESIVDNSGNPLVAGSGTNFVTPITVTYRSLTPNAYFHLNFRSPFSQVDDELWSETITSNNPNGGLWISASSQLVIGSELGFITMDPETDGINFNVDDENTVYSGGLPISTTGATWDLEVNGDEPTDPTVTPDSDNNVNIYTWDDLGNGNININEFVPMTDKVPETGSGGIYEFDPNQSQLTEFLTDTVKGDDIGPVIVTGGGGIVTVISNVSTDFLPSTPMVGKNRSTQRNTAPNLKTYNLLEYYYNSDEVIESAGFSINEGTLTFSGVEVTAGELYTLKAPILSGKAHKLTYDVSGLPSNNAFEFRVFDRFFPGAVSDGAGESFFTSSVNYSYIAIVFRNDFSASDTMTITNLRLLLEKVETDKLTIRFQTTLGIDFNLGFATSEEDLREKLRQGKDVTKVPQWYPGTSLTLTKRTVGNQDDVDVVDSFEYQDLQEQLSEALDNVNDLSDQIDTLTNNHAVELENLNNQLATDASAAAAALDAANDAYSVLQDEKDDIQLSLDSLENIILEIDDVNSEADITTLINEYETNKDDVNQALTNIVANLSEVDSNIISNTALSAQVADLTNKLDEAYALIGLQQDTIFDKDQQIINLANEVSRLEGKLSEANSEINRLKDEVQSLTNELSIAQSQIDSLKIINEQLNLLIESGNLESQANAETIRDLTQRLNEALGLINSLEGTIESQDGEILSLNDVIDILNTRIELLQSQLNTQQSDSESNTQELQEEINQLTLLNNSLTTKLDFADQQIDTLEATIEANSQYVITQAEFNTLQDKYNDLASSFSDLEFYFDELLIQFNQSQANVDDGITQADVDAAFDAGVASVDISNIISEHDQLNTHTSGTELITNGDFKEPVTSWAGENWVFQDGFAISNSRSIGESKGLAQRLDLDIGSYFLNVDTLEISGCNLRVVFLSDKGEVVLKQTIDAKENKIKLIQLARKCKSVIIFVNQDKQESKDYNVVIDEISLKTFSNDGSVTAKLILELLAYINQVDAQTQNLESIVLDQIRTIRSLRNELEQAREDIIEYVQALHSSNDNIVSLASVMLDVISDLGISSTVTAEDVANLTNTFNSEQLSLSEAISSQSNLVNSLTSLLSEVDGSSISSSPNNEKWLLTISGGFPVETSYSMWLFDNAGNQNLLIKNPNIPDLETLDLNDLANQNNNFLQNNGFTLIRGFADMPNQRIQNHLTPASAGVQSGFSQSSEPEWKIIQALNDISGRTNYNNELHRYVDDEFYDGNPNTFYVPFYSPQVEKSFTIKFTFLNYNPRLAVVDTNGNPYSSSSTGDRILGNRGNQRPIATSTSYLENLGVTDGLQIEIEFLGGETGWELYKYKSTLGTLEKINSQQSVPLIVDNTKTWSFNLSNPSDPDYILPGGANTILHIEKIQEAPSSSSRIASDGVESFVNALTLPSYNGQNLNSNSYMNPSSSSDIIMNKSRDIEPDLSAHVLGAKRVSKNKI